MAALKLPAVSKLGEAKAAAFNKPGALSGKTLGGIGTMRAKTGGATAASAESPGESPAAAAEKPAPTPSGGKVAAIPVAARSGAKTAAAAVTPAAGVAAQRAVAAVPRAGAAARAIAPSALPERTWTVAVTDDQHQEMTLAQIVDAYAAHTIDAETFVWRDGMQDWLMPFEIAEIATALRARRLSPRTNEPAAEGTESAPVGEEAGFGAWREPGRWDRDEPPPSEANFDDVTVAMAAPKAQALLEAVAAEDAAAASGPKSDDPTALGEAPALTMAALGFGEDEAPPAAAPDAVPTANAGDTGERQPEKLPFELAPSALPGRAALRSESGEGGVKRDLFARRAEQDGIVTEAELPPSEAPVSVAAESEGSEGAAAAKTGARNESSVLFSLDQLAKKDTKAAPKPKKKSDEAAILLGGSDATVGGVIAPAPAGGLFGQTSMAAPDFTAPPPPSVPPPAPGKTTPSGSPAPAKSKSNTGLWIALMVVVVAGAAVLLKGSPPPPPSPVPTSSPQAAQPAAVPPAPAAPTAPAASETEAPAASAAAAPADSAAAPGASATGSALGATPSAATPAAAGTAPAATAPGTPAAAPATARPQASAAPKPSAAAEPAAAEGPDFDKDAASAALATAAARAESECASQEGTHGTGKVAVTFANSGRATNALVSGDFAGSALGGCVAKIFRGVKVPAFGGEQVRVSKTVRIP